MNRDFIQNSNIVFRKIIKSTNCMDVVKNFIECILNVKIKNIKFNNPEELRVYNDKEYGIAEFRIITTNNYEINVGIQVIDGSFISNKLLLYYAKVHSNQVLYKDSRKIVRTITINILDEIFFNSEEYQKVIKIRTNNNNENAIETIELHTLELPKFNVNRTYNISKKDAWLMYLKGENQENIKIAKEVNKEIKKLDELVKRYWESEVI